MAVFVILIAHHNIVKNTQMVTALAINQLILFF